MKLDDFDLFAAAARLGNLHRAAEECGTTQSSLSKAIARLEKRYQIRIFNRSAYGVALTPDGQALLAGAERLRTTLRDISDEMHTRRHGNEGKVRLGCLPILIEPIVIPIVMSDLQRPGSICYSVAAKLTPYLYADLEAGALDLAVAVYTDAVPATLSYDLIAGFRKASYRVVARKGHPLLRGAMDPGALVSARWVLPSSQVPPRIWLEASLARFELPPANVFLESDLHPFNVAHLVERSDLLTVMPAGMLKFPAAKGLAALDLPQFPQPEGRLAIFWRKNAYLTPFAQQTRARLHEQLKIFQAD
ncbi:LysR family transcriptional regulator [Acidovorax cavernicola]|uniref:LysR family transcriptional regulator n=1 Tax=Acidovorax cavernicola TaxID=1675792 RepID=A0A9X8D686_9BURK|nr:LysR family transcriptional regulator [Acidovorax cavernicola]RIX81963.1 LysR family transcriptional regulator [Acidovorax cavernicola]